jgi:signal transduction histidine kinase/ActR/RegA family two-component response regulator
MDDTLFGSALWKPVLEKYSAVTSLTVELFDNQGRLVLPLDRTTPLYRLLHDRNADNGLFGRCAAQALLQTGLRPAVIESDTHGLLAVGVSLVLEDEIVGAAVAGYALSRFPQASAVQQWAREVEVPFDRLWEIVRQQPPMPERRLRLHGELLQVLGDSLLRENLRTRQYESVGRQLQKMDAAKDEFLAVLSHELRAPLAPIMGWASVLKKYEGSEQVRRAAHVIERNVLRQRRMIEDLLDINLITHGSLRLDLRAHSLADLVSAALETCTPALKAKAITLEQVGLNEGLSVNGDGGRLVQVFTNVLSNAAKFTPEGGTIRVTLMREGEEAVLTVADKGKGIAPDFLPFVFDIFRQQEQGTRREHEGLGIGLSLVKRLTELHKGTVTVTSAGLGKGSEVVVRLPLAAVRADELDRPKSSSESDEQPLLGLAILLVEDSDDAREALAILLGFLGARVSNAREGREGLAMVSASSPDVVLCDLRMPRMDGYEFIRELRQLPNPPPVIAMSGLVTAADRDRTRQAGFSAHIAKPFDEAAIIAAVSVTMGGNGAKGSSLSDKELGAALEAEWRDARS